jgi:hypothetical protein
VEENQQKGKVVEGKKKAKAKRSHENAKVTAKRM